MKFVWFSPVNLSYFNLVIRPAKNLEGEGKNFPPLQKGKTRLRVWHIEGILSRVDNLDASAQRWKFKSWI